MTTPTGYARVDGPQMYYQMHGVGRLVVLLHGGLYTMNLSFGPMLLALAATRQAIAVELQPNHSRFTRRTNPAYRESAWKRGIV